jgi:hypothetical protein
MLLAFKLASTPSRLSDAVVLIGAVPVDKGLYDRLTSQGGTQNDYRRLRFEILDSSEVLFEKARCRRWGSSRLRVNFDFDQPD